MISVSNLAKHYGDQTLFEGVTLQFDPGERYGVVGANGSGKSTLLNILGCLDRPSGGTYELESQDVGSLTSPELTMIRRHKIGFVFQFFHLIPRLTARQNVELPMVFAGLPAAERRQRSSDAITAVGLSHRAEHLPEQLSGGERQRVAMARATVMRPRLLLADEPTGNLDSRTGEEILQVIDELHAEGKTIVMVTHDDAIAHRAERIIRVSDGEIVSNDWKGVSQL